MPQRISVNNLLIADLAIFRQWINNDQRAITTPFSVGIEIFCLKYFSDTKFVYSKIVELHVFAWTNIVTHLLQEFCFSQNLSAIIIFQNRSQDSTLISVLLNAFLTVSLICIFLLFETYRVTTTNISPDDKSTSRVLLILQL